MKQGIMFCSAILGIVGMCAAAQASNSPNTVPTLNLPDPDIVTAFQKAATQNVLPAVNSNVFPGYWCVCADGQGYGYGNTYPSVDGGQMNNALLCAGQVTVVEGNFNYVKSFMQSNGLLPFAIFPASAGKSVLCAKIDGKNYYAQVAANGGIYTSWVPENTLGATGSINYIQNADAIFRYTQDRSWLTQQLPSVNLTADYLASLTTSAGLVGGAGFYTEMPTRSPYDGVTQGYAADAFQRAASLNALAGNQQAAQKYQALASLIISKFQSSTTSGGFWAGDQSCFAQYISASHGAVTSHGLTDTDWSAIALGMATPAQTAALWPQLQAATSQFYYGGMPTGVAQLPSTYQNWESSNTSNRNDVAAMGRAWLLEAGARVKMGDGQGLVDSISKVAQVGKTGGYYWQERYNAAGGYGVSEYCEYPANLMTIV